MADDDEAVESPAERTAIVKRVQLVHEGFLQVREAVVSHPRHDGRWQTVTRESMDRPDSVAVALVDRPRRVIWLAEQFRFPTLSSGSGWIEELPSGSIDAGESAEAAAAREVAEETGFVDLELSHISSFFVSPGGTSERVELFLAYVDGREPDLRRSARLQDADEDIRLVRTDLDAFLSKAASGDLEDAKTLIAGLWLLAHPDRLQS